MKLDGKSQGSLKNKHSLANRRRIVVKAVPYYRLLLETYLGYTAV